MTTEHTCAVKVYPRERWGSVRGRACGKPAPLEHDGKWFCKLHHPPTKQAREAAKQKCALCSTAVNGVKYCKFHATVEIDRGRYERMLALEKAATR